MRLENALLTFKPISVFYFVKTSQESIRNSDILNYRDITIVILTMVLFRSVYGKSHQNREKSRDGLHWTLSYSPTSKW